MKNDTQKFDINKYAADSVNEFPEVTVGWRQLKLRGFMEQAYRFGQESMVAVSTASKLTTCTRCLGSGGRPGIASGFCMRCSGSGYEDTSTRQPVPQEPAK